MTCPHPYRPPPVIDTKATEVMEAARLRARWRRYMGLRWRWPDAREEDRKAGRLPEDWHDAVDCPGIEGEYQKQGCTCDEMPKRSKSKRFGTVKGKTAASGKSIDPVKGVIMLGPYAHRYYRAVRTCVLGCDRRRPLARRPLGREAGGSVRLPPGTSFT